MKMRKLNSQGVTHIVLPLVAIFVTVAVGTYFLVASHADTPDTTATTDATAASPTVNLTNANNNQTLNVKLGQTVQVELSNTFWPEGSVPAGKSETTTSWWNNFASSNTRVLATPHTGTITKQSGKYQKVADLGVKEVIGSSLHSFTAVGPGSATITASSETTYVCGAGVGCPALAVVNHFGVTIVVQ